MQVGREVSVGNNDVTAHVANHLVFIGDSRVHQQYHELNDYFSDLPATKRVKTYHNERTKVGNYLYIVSKFCF